MNAIADFYDSELGKKNKKLSRESREHLAESGKMISDDFINWIKENGK